MNQRGLPNVFSTHYQKGLQIVTRVLLLAGLCIWTPTASWGIAVPLENVVQNPNFSEGNANWVTNNMNIGYYGSDPTNSSEVWEASSGCVGAGCMDQNSGSYIQQTLNTQPGQTYDLTFAVAEIGGSTSEMAVYWDGNLVSDILNPANDTCGMDDGLDSFSCDYVVYSFTGLLSTSEETVLQVNGRQDPGEMYFTNFTVTPEFPTVQSQFRWSDFAGGSVPTPEPGSLCLFAWALAPYLGMRLRKRLSRS